MKRFLLICGLAVLATLTIMFGTAHCNIYLGEVGVNDTISIPVICVDTTKGFDAIPDSSALIVRYQGNGANTVCYRDSATGANNVILDSTKIWSIPIWFMAPRVVGTIDSNLGNGYYWGDIITFDGGKAFHNRFSFYKIGSTSAGDDNAIDHYGINLNVNVKTASTSAIDSGDIALGTRNVNVVSDGYTPDVNVVSDSYTPDVNIASANSGSIDSADIALGVRNVNVVSDSYTPDVNIASANSSSIDSADIALGVRNVNVVSAGNAAIDSADIALGKRNVNVISLAKDVITDSNIIANGIVAADIANGALDSATFAGAYITNASIAPTASAEIADDVWDEDSTGHYTSPNMAYVASQTAAGSTPPTVSEIWHYRVDTMAVAGDAARFGQAGNRLRLAGDSTDFATVDTVRKLVLNVHDSVWSASNSPNRSLSIFDEDNFAAGDLDINSTVVGTLNYLDKDLTSIDFAGVGIGSVSGAVGGSVGSISGITFPTNFSTMGISASGYVSPNFSAISGTLDSAETGATFISAHWSKDITGYTGTTAGGKLNSAASAGDPWSTAIPTSGRNGRLVCSSSLFSNLI